jgi:hypothetical protein
MIHDLAPAKLLSLSDLSVRICAFSANWDDTFSRDVAFFSISILNSINWDAAFVLLFTASSISLVELT